MNLPTCQARHQHFIVSHLTEAHCVGTSIHWRSHSGKQVVPSETVKYMSIPTHAIPKDLYKTDIVTSTWMFTGDNHTSTPHPRKWMTTVG